MARKWGFAACGGLLLCLFVAPVLAAGPGAAAGDPEGDLRAINPAEHLERLAGYQSRFTGYPGCYEAERYIADS